MTFREALEHWISGDYNPRHHLKHFLDHCAMQDDVVELSNRLQNWMDNAYGAHRHNLTDIDDLADALDAKADLAHSHIVNDITGLQAILNSKAAATHSHSMSDVTGLGAALDLKLNAADAFSGDYGDLNNKPVLFSGSYLDLSDKPSSFPPATHNHAIADVTGLQMSLDGKIAKSPKAGAIANTVGDASSASVTILGISVPTNASYTALVAAHNALKDKVNTILAALRSRDIIDV